MIPLPFGVGDLHLQAECTHLRHRGTPRGFVFGDECVCLLHIIGLRNPHDATRGRTQRDAMCHAGKTLFGLLAGGVHQAQILAAVALDDDVTAWRRWRHDILPPVELLAIPLERYFDEVRHLSR